MLAAGFRKSSGINIRMFAKKICRRMPDVMLADSDSRGCSSEICKTTSHLAAQGRQGRSEDSSETTAKAIALLRESKAPTTFWYFLAPVLREVCTFSSFKLLLRYILDNGEVAITVDAAWDIPKIRKYVEKMNLRPVDGREASERTGKVQAQMQQ